MMTDDGLNPTEFWIMTTVREAQAPLAWLSAPSREEIFNLYAPDTPLGALVDTLESLFTSGDLVMKRKVASDRASAAKSPFDPPYTPDRAEIEQYILEDAPIGHFTRYYGMTEQGGRRWEREAHPRWDLYYDSWLDPTRYGPDEGEGGIAAGDREFIEQYLADWRCIW